MSFFDDIEDDLEFDTYEGLKQGVSSDQMEHFVKDCVLSILPSNIRIGDYKSNNDSVKDCFEILTSAAYHLLKGRLYAEVDCNNKTYPSYLRLSEIERLFNVKLPCGRKENYAVDYGKFILYLHMDNIQGGYDDIHFNRYLYNNGKDEMSFFDALNDNALLPYSQWRWRIENKPVIVFGYKNLEITGSPLWSWSPILKFLGYHKSLSDIDEIGNFKLSFAKSYDV